MTTGSYRPSTSRSPASLVPWSLPVSSKRQYSGIPSPAYHTALVAGVVVGRRGGGDLQHEVRRLPLLRDDVGVAVPVGSGVGVEGDEQVGVDPVPGRRAGFFDQVALARDDGGFGLAQVVREPVGVAVPGEVVEAKLKPR